VPDPREAFGEHVEEKPTDEFLGRERITFTLFSWV
jgi:hypothetical protein